MRQSTIQDSGDNMYRTSISGLCIRRWSICSISATMRNRLAYCPAFINTSSTRSRPTGDIEIQNIFIFHSTIDQFLAGLIHHQDFPLCGISVSIRRKRWGGRERGMQRTSWPPALRMVFKMTSQRITLLAERPFKKTPSMLGREVRHLLSRWTLIIEVLILAGSLEQDDCRKQKRRRDRRTRQTEATEIPSK